MTPASLTYDTLFSKLIEVVPEVRAAYEQELRWWKGETPGQHVLVGDVLTPYVITLLQSEGHEDRLKRIFDFLEKLAGHHDPKIQEVVQFSVCERLGDNRTWLDKAREYMGPATLRLSLEVERFHGRE